MCLFSFTGLRRISRFEVLRDFMLPSDHAPITITMSVPDQNLNNLSLRAGYLGDHAILYNPDCSGRKAKKPLHMSTIDERKFLDKIHLIDIPSEVDQIENVVKNVSNNMYECARQCKANLQFS